MVTAFQPFPLKRIPPALREITCKQPSSCLCSACHLRPLSEVGLRSRALPMTHEAGQPSECYFRARLESGVCSPPHLCLPSSTCPCSKGIEGRGTASWCPTSQEWNLCPRIGDSLLYERGAFLFIDLPKAKAATPTTCHLNKSRLITFGPKGTCYNWNIFFFLQLEYLMCQPGGSLVMMLCMVNGLMWSHFPPYCPLSLNMPSSQHGGIVLLPGSSFAL